jgi:hypothetical protein
MTETSWHDSGSDRVKRLAYARYALFGYWLAQRRLNHEAR